MTRPSVVISCAHVGKLGAVSPCKRLVESGFSKRVAIELGGALRARGIDYTILELPNGPEKVRAIRDLLPYTTLRIEPHVNAYVGPDKFDQDEDGDRLELVPRDDIVGTMVIHRAGDGESEALAMATSIELARATNGRKAYGPVTCPGVWVRHERLEFLHGNAPTKAEPEPEPLPGAAIMPELLFSTAKSDVEFLLQPRTPALLAAALADGVVAWIHQAGKVAL